MKSACRRALLLAAAALLGACGQKGPLYLPDESGEVVTRPAPGAEATPAATAPAEAPPADAAEPEPRVNRSDGARDR